MNKKIGIPLTLLMLIASIVLRATPVTASLTGTIDRGPVTTTSTSWSIAPESTSGGTATTALSLGTVPSNNGKLMFLVNLGTIASTSEVITPTTPNGARTVVFAYCRISIGVYGSWTGTGPYSCATGTLTTVCTVSSSVTTCPATLPIAVGANVQLRIKPSANLSETVNVSLQNITNTRGAITTNS